MPAPDFSEPSPSRETLQLRDWLGVLALAAAGVIAAALSLPSAKAQAGAAALVYPPWTSRHEAIARSFAAGHQVLRGGIWPFVVIVVPPPEAAAESPGPDGAWQVALDGLAGCLDPGPSLMSRAR